MGFRTGGQMSFQARRRRQRRRCRIDCPSSVRPIRAFPQEAVVTQPSAEATITRAADSSATKSSATATSVMIYGIAFVTGAIVMSFEMLGSRYLNPYFGSGIYTWASLISTVLMALTLGLLPRRLARRPHRLAQRAGRHRAGRLALYAGAALLRAAAARIPARRHRRRPHRQPGRLAGDPVVSGDLLRHVFAVRDPADAALRAELRQGVGHGLRRLDRRLDRRHARHHLLPDPDHRHARDHAVRSAPPASPAGWSCWRSAALERKAGAAAAALLLAVALVAAAAPAPPTTR